MNKEEINFTISDRLPRDRFVFPEVLVGIFKDNDAIVDALETAVVNEVREKRINNISDEAILKNVIGPFFNDLSIEEKRILINIVGEMRNEKIKQDQEKPLGGASNRKPLFDKKSFQEAINGAKELLDSEAGRAGITNGEVSREISGEIRPVSDGAALEGRIIFDEDSDDSKN